MTIASCPQCALFRKQISALPLDNEQLRVERDFFKKQCAHEERENKRSAHPFRKNDDQLQNGPPKTPGRPDNHPPANRPEPENIDQVLPVAITTCPDCGTHLTDLQTHSQSQSDIVVSTIEREFQLESGFCPCCKCRHHGRDPLQTSDALGAAGNQIGPVVLTNVTIYAIRYSRGGDVPTEILGDTFEGTLIVDGLNSYEVLAYTKGARTDLVNHLLREACYRMLSPTGIYTPINQVQVRHAGPALRCFTYRKYVYHGQA